MPDKMKIIIAPQDGIEQFDVETDEFLHRIFDIDGALVTDESEITDFVCMTRDSAEELKLTYDRIELEYGLDVKPHRNILEILQLIHQHNQVGHA